MNIVPGFLAAFLGLVDEHKPAAQRGKVFVKPHSTKIFHVISHLPPKRSAAGGLQRRSFYQQYKPLNAPRRTGCKAVTK